MSAHFFFFFMPCLSWMFSDFAITLMRVAVPRGTAIHRLLSVNFGRMNPRSMALCFLAARAFGDQHRGMAESNMTAAQEQTKRRPEHGITS